VLFSQKADQLAGTLDYDNANNYLEERLDDFDYDFSIAPKASGPNNYYATLAMMNTNEDSKDKDPKMATKEESINASTINSSPIKADHSNEAEAVSMKENVSSTAINLGTAALASTPSVVIGVIRDNSDESQ
jgi:hypothetical protein